MPTTHCNHSLLQQSLSEQLTQRDEELLAAHLTECEACREALEKLAADGGSWQHVGRVLREETSGEHGKAADVGSTLLPRVPLSHDEADDDYDGPKLKPSDFIVDFLQPSENKESLGRLGNIEIREFIGQGAHGIVLKGFQEELNRLVAVKVMAPHLASVVAARKRFAREARATAAIVHPNVMPILHVDSSGQLPFLVMPYVDCESLQDRLDREGSLPILDVLRISLQVARGLAAAHAQGLVHRDVKPANILLERGVERVMLTDFGLARAVDDATLTRSGLIAGTPHYMSPEQARGEGVDARSDLFSLGSVLYALSTGRPPFRAETTYGILRRVTDETARSMRELNPDVPAWFDAVVLKLLAKSATGRFESAEQIASIFEECLGHLQQPTACPLPLVVQELMPEKTTRPWKKLLLLAGVVLAFISISDIAATWIQSRKSAADIELLGAESGPIEITQPPPWDDDVEEDLKSLDMELDSLLEQTTPL